MDKQLEPYVKRVEKIIRAHAGKDPASIAHEIVIREIEAGTEFGTKGKAADIPLSPAVASGPPEDMMFDLADRLARLSPRQRATLELVREGYSNKKIARAFGVSERTVKIHMMAVKRKLGTHNRTEAAVLLDRHERGVL